MTAMTCLLDKIIGARHTSIGVPQSPTSTPRRLYSTSLVRIDMQDSSSPPFNRHAPGMLCNDLQRLAVVINYLQMLRSSAKLQLQRVLTSIYAGKSRSVHVPEYRKHSQLVGLQPCLSGAGCRTCGICRGYSNSSATNKSAPCPLSCIYPYAVQVALLEARQRQCWPGLSTCLVISMES